jgi:hypothetical protein
MEQTAEEIAADENTSPELLRILFTCHLNILRSIAKHPHTDIEVLKELSKFSDSEIEKNLIKNPNSPNSVLLNLAIKFPEELLENPIFSKFLLKNPNLLKELNLILQTNSRRITSV